MINATLALAAASDGRSEMLYGPDDKPLPDEPLRPEFMTSPAFALNELKAPLSFASFVPAVVDADGKGRREAVMPNRQVLLDGSR